MKIDFSHKIDELEAVHKNHAESDIRASHKHINDWITNDPPTNSELAVLQRQVVEGLKPVLMKLFY